MQGEGPSLPPSLTGGATGQQRADESGCSDGQRDPGQGTVRVGQLRPQGPGGGDGGGRRSQPAGQAQRSLGEIAGGLEGNEAGDGSAQQGEGCHHGEQSSGDLVGGTGNQRVRRNLAGRDDGAVGDPDDLDVHALDQVRKGHAPQDGG